MLLWLCLPDGDCGVDSRRTGANDTHGVLYPDTPVRLQLWRVAEKQAYFRLMNLKTEKPVLNRGVFEWK